MKSLKPCEIDDVTNELGNSWITYDDIIGSCCHQLLLFLAKIDEARISNKILLLNCEDPLNGITYKELSLAFNVLSKLKENLLIKEKKNEKI